MRGCCRNPRPPSPPPTPAPPDPPPPVLPVLSIAALNATVTEGDTGTQHATFRVTLSAPSSTAVSATWTVSGAFSGQPLPQGSVTLAPGQTQATISLPVHGDLIPEPDSDFVITLSGPQGATLGTASAAGRIIDDDPPLLVRADSAAALAAGPVVTGNVLANDQGKGLTVTTPAVALIGALGTLTLGANGQFSYAASHAQALPQGVTGTDVFTYGVRDASGATGSATLTITVTGINDPATITGLRSGSVAVTDPAAWQTGGRLVVTDPDIGESRFAAPGSTAGSHGQFTFDPLTGNWGYLLAAGSAAVQALAPGSSATDSLDVQSLDGTASARITVTITAPPPPPVEPSGVVSIRQAVQGSVSGAGTQVGVTLADGSRQVVQTDSQGRFDLPPLPETGATLDLVRSYSIGTDKLLSVFDVIALFNLVSGSAPPAVRDDPRNLIAADYNGNGIADIFDVIDLFRFVAGYAVAIAPQYVFVADAALPAATATQIPMGAQLSVFDDLSHDAFTAILRGDLAGYV